MNTENCQSLDRKNIDIVLYHGSCPDGFGSAFIVWYYYKKNFDSERAKSISYIPCYYLKKDQQLTNDYLQKLSGKNILMCDFSYSYSELVRIIGVCKSFIILDHHKTAEENLKNIPPHLKIFDMKRSGVGITWNFMFDDQPLPNFLAHIQDRDIWAYQIPKTQEFITYFDQQHFDFELWEKYLDENFVNHAIEKGTNWMEYQQILIANIIKKASYIIQEIDNKYYIVIYCNSSEFKSDIGNKVFDKIPIGDFSCIWDYNLYRDCSNYSLRSTDDRVDVTIIAKKFDCGGHRNSSGVKFQGMVGYLPFPKVDDFGLIDLLIHGKKNKIRMNDEEIPYIIFQIEELNDKWLEEKYFNLIKRKCDDSIFIVFEKVSSSVDIDTKTGTVSPLKDYLVYYNGNSTANNPLKTLQFMAINSENLFLEFTTAKEFDELFTGDKLFTKENDLSDDDIDAEPNDKYYEKEMDDW